MNKKLRSKLYEIIFEADTKAGKIFDIILLLIIILSISLVMIESVSSMNTKYGYLLKKAEWAITIIFTLEYILRALIVKKAFRYIFSFYGIIDFISVIPTYIALIFTGAQSLLVLRGIRLLRVFRILKLSRYTKASNFIIDSLKASRAKIGVFLFAIIMIVIIIGTFMYLIEGKENGFTNIPRSIYWAIVTLTTVGYGDISPQTAFGQFLAGIVMILGYAIIAVPTGIVTANFIQSDKKSSAKICSGCLKEGHDKDAVYCKFCGKLLND